MTTAERVFRRAARRERMLWAMLGAALVLGGVGLVLATLQIGRINKEARARAAATARELEAFKRLQRLERPTDAELAVRARASIEACGRDPECRKLFLVVVKRVRVDIRPRIIRVTRTRVVRVTVGQARPKSAPVRSPPAPVLRPRPPAARSPTSKPVVVKPGPEPAPAPTPAPTPTTPAGTPKPGNPAPGPTPGNEPTSPSAPHCVPPPYC